MAGWGPGVSESSLSRVINAPQSGWNTLAGAGILAADVSCTSEIVGGASRLPSESDCGNAD